MLQYRLINNRPLNSFFRPIPLPAKLEEDATNGDLLERAQEGRLGIMEANERFKVLNEFFSTTLPPNGGQNNDATP